MKDFLFMNCFRRTAIEHLAEEKPQEAVYLLMNVPSWYLDMIEPHGVRYTSAGDDRNEGPGGSNGGDVDMAGRISADVEETEAIFDGYWEGALKETRWELAEQRRAAAATALAAQLAPAVAELRYAFR